MISVEDQRFYDHNGVDVIRVGAAVLRNVQEGRRAEGGSTITQQLARQTFLSRDKTYRRKLKEVILAAHIENVYTKKEILELYLNKVYFGDGLYGVEAASRGYFGKHAAELDVDEAALLAGLIQSPSSYAPTVNLERALARRNVVLQAMVSTGAIERADRRAARRTTRSRSTTRSRFKRTFGLYFKEQVRRELVERFGWQRVYQGGLKVYTTLDADLQQAAEKMLEDGLAAIEKRRGYKHTPRCESDAGARRRTAQPDYLQGALVAMDPRTATSARWSAAAISARAASTAPRRRSGRPARRSSRSSTPPRSRPGYSPATVISNLNAPIAHAAGRAGCPRTSTPAPSSMTMRTALRTSSNRAAVQMLNTVGIPKAVELRPEAERRHAAERAVAGARRERRHAGVADRGVRRLRERRDRPHAGADPPGRRQRRQGPLNEEAEVAPRRSAKRPRS